MRHLASLQLAQLAATPANPPSGHHSLFMGSDGKLHQLTSAGTDTVISGGGGGGSTTLKAVKAADEDIASTTLVNVAGMGIPVTPGLYRLEGVVKLGNKGHSSLALNGPAASLFAMLNTAAATAGSFAGFTYDTTQALNYGDAATLGSSADSALQTVVSGALNVTAPGTVNLQASFNPKIFDNSGVLTPYTWTWSGGLETGTVFHSGTDSLRLTPETTSPTWLYPYQLAVIAGQSYTFSVWMHSAAGFAGTGIAIAWRDVNDSVIGTEVTSISSIAANTWTQRTITQTAPSGAAGAVVRIGYNGGTAATNYLHIDDVLFTANSAALTVRAGSFLALTPL
ncbi:hypothetical protein ACQP25_44490 (plasmid) [Microtetraspora malaysiensis]|uniref:hypothetical protein n=1 Tax=Microtetraspora malaysiensis TaxID=161358 RepID=UPI003D8E54C3